MIDFVLTFIFTCSEDSVLFYARAQHDFEGDANPRMLPLTRGDLVHVISTRAKEQGWWKGWLNGRVRPRCIFPLIVNSVKSTLTHIMDP